MKPKIRVLQASYGNVFSVSKALERAGAALVVGEADAYVLPGVGSFPSGVQALKKFAPLLEEVRQGKKPFLGICLGMQLLFKRSEEGKGRGLGWLEGAVKKIEAPKLPHIGWNTVWFENSRLAEGEAWCYFVHSYACPPGTHVKGWTKYGQRFPAVVEKDNIFGVQFHPEKSGSSGLKLLDTFMEVVRQWK